MTKGIYIVYNKKTMQIVNVFDWYGQAADFSKQDNNLVVLNKTHPKNKEMLKTLKINFPPLQ